MGFSEKGEIESGRPFIFLAHNDCDKHRIEPFIARLLADDVTVFIDSTSAFDCFDDAISASRLLAIPGGHNWARELDRAIEACSCVIGCISMTTIDPAEDSAREFPLDEMKTARRLKKGFLVVEIEQGAFGNFLRHANLDDRRLGRLQTLPLRTTRFEHDFEVIGQSVHVLSQGKIRFGGAHSYSRLAAEQSALARDLRGLPSAIVVDHYEDRARRYACRLVPGRPGEVPYFWLTDLPVRDTLRTPADVRAVLQDIVNFRLPTERELESALAPLGRDVPGDNPFGFRVELSRGIWAARGSEIVMVGREGDGPAPLYLVYVN